MSTNMRKFAVAAGKLLAKTLISGSARHKVFLWTCGRPEVQKPPSLFPRLTKLRMLRRAAVVPRRAAPLVMRHGPERPLCSAVSAAKASLIRDLLVNKSALFKKLDKDGSGSVDAKELAEALKAAGATKVTVEQAAAIIKEADKDGNGSIEINELAGVLTKGTLFAGVIRGTGSRH